jgi:hypothetical protein
MLWYDICYCKYGATEGWHRACRGNAAMQGLCLVWMLQGEARSVPGGVGDFGGD